MAIGQQRLPVGARPTTFRLNYMSSKSTNNDELHLKHQRPVAGESRRFTTGEAVFFSPLPVPTGQISMDLGGSFLDINDTYLDLGSSNVNKAFQTRVMIASSMLILIVSLIIGPFIAGLMSFGDPYGRTFTHIFIEFFPTGAAIGVWGAAGAAVLGLYVVTSTTLAKVRTRPIRFNRQRREVCFFANGSDEPIIQPWEEMVSWLSVSTGVTGVGVISTYTFGMAFDDPKTDTVHLVNQEVMTPVHGLCKWEALRAYMEKGPEFCPAKAPYEGRHTFDKERQDMHEEYQHNERSALGVCWWYLTHLITWWRFPYWVAEWDHRFSMKSLPDSIAEWSKPLPPDQWGKPSPALKEQSAKIERAFAQGQDFMTYFKANLNESKAEE
ncbi:DUF6708 domain-containing protein [Pseudomonas sp. Choline-02u-1]|jgi:hypothetical protein|uniref:DUF6708 domain-containing protein n=1 Tax=Pseudomonas sp. Choline-02u-1 TaxID=2058307 RepID=UPI003531ECE0